MMQSVTFGMGEVAAPPPTAGYPTSGDRRQLQINNPAQVRIDAANLRKLDFPAPDTGNAYDPRFQAAVRAFQIRAGVAIVGPADGLIGPRTRAALEDMSRAMGPGAEIDPFEAAELPGLVSSGAAKPVSASGGGLPVSKLALYAGGAAAAIGLGWYLLK